MRDAVHGSSLTLPALDEERRAGVPIERLSGIGLNKPGRADTFMTQFTEDGELRALFRNRADAGRLLADRLKELSMSDPIVLAIPRGGVVVGAEISRALKCGLDIVAPRKLTDPNEPELAIGAVMPDGSVYLNSEVIAIRMVPRQYIEEEKARQMAEASRRMSAYRKGKPYPKLGSRTVILVDDGIATGATAIAAARWIRKQRPSSLIIATPVIPEEMLGTVSAEADRLVYLKAPTLFAAIGQFYTEFDQVEDAEVIKLLG